MDYIALGKSNLLVSRTAFGAMALDKLPSQDDVNALVKLAFDSGVNFFDTSKSTPECERRLGEAIRALKIRDDVFIATKTSAHNAEEIAEDIDESLRNLGIDTIDLYQLEKVLYLPELGGDDGVAEKLQNLRKSGVIGHFGVATESNEIALSVMSSGVPWETIQLPFNMLCSEEVERIVERFAALDIGFIAMRPLCGGLVDNIPLAIGYLMQFENAVPLWGVRSLDELRQILYFEQNPPVVDEQFLAEVRHKRDLFN